MAEELNNIAQANNAAGGAADSAGSAAGAPAGGAASGGTGAPTNGTGTPTGAVAPDAAGNAAGGAAAPDPANNESGEPQGGGKKKKKESRQEKKERNRAEKLADVGTLRRTAKEVKRHTLLSRIIALVIGLLVAVIAVTYVISYFYDKFGAFTVKVNKYDMAKQGLSLSEEPEYERTVSELNAKIVYDMTNISGEDLPPTVDKINGSHNGENYIAYTFYLSNAGRDTVSYEGEMVIENVTKSVDDAIRIAIYINGQKTVYGKTKSNGGGKESDCDKEFLSSTVVMRTQKEGFAPKDRDKYTVVIWLEGNDPDCVDAIVGGTIKFSMNFKIMETT